MKKCLLLILSCWMVSCSYQYKIGVAPGTPASECSVFQFNNRVDVIEVDGVPFQKNKTIWQEGVHRITLLPGKHTFKFKFAMGIGGPGWSGSASLAEPNLVGADFKAGVKYVITWEIAGPKISFKIEEYDSARKAHPDPLYLPLLEG